jgi:transcription elongation factor
MSKKLITKCVPTGILSKPSKVVFLLAHSQGRKRGVLHTYQSFFAFLHNRDITENGGVIVTRVRSLASQAPKGNIVREVLICPK